MKERPKLLCKFRPWKLTVERDHKTGALVERHRTKDLLQKAEFFCQPPRFFDDPHDGLQGARATGSVRDLDRFIMHNIGADVLNVMRKHGLGGITQHGEVKDPADAQIIKRSERKHSRRQTRVLSLSGDPKNELMWSFYADSHQGVCLCFDSAHAFFAKARSVTYVNSPSEIEEPVNDVPTEDPLLYAKGQVWSWQKEWRLVWPGEEPKLVAFPRETLKVVILGEWFPHARFNELAETLELGGYQVELLQMERLPDSFDYQFVPLWIERKPGRHS